MAVIHMPGSAPTLAPSSPVEDTDEGVPSLTPEDARETKKREKFRSAWISFASRIIAQVVGAVVGVALTLFVVQQAQKETQRAAALPVDTAAVIPAADRALVPAPSIASGEVSVAVLPLDNFSGDPSQAYLADGLTEAIIAELAQLGNIRVTSRTSSAQYRGARKSLPDIARELGVTHLIEGSLVRDGNRVRVTAQLIEAASDRHVWARAYDRTVTDMLSLQAETASAIVTDVSSTLWPRESRPPAVSPAVHDVSAVVN
jgi:TolB-like protein